MRNLHLDERYRAIALILAIHHYDQSEKPENHEDGMSEAQIREWADLYCSAHFATTREGGMPALLDEMVKLSIVQQSGSRYRLRNPHIAMMLGDRETVENALDALSRTKPSQPLERAQRRVHMHRPPQQLLFPMPVGWLRSIVREGNPDSQLLIVAGNGMSGIEELNSAERGDWTLLDRTVVLSLIAGRGPQYLLTQIGNERATRATRSPRIFCVRAGQWRVSEIPEFAAAAAKAAKVGCRVMLLAPPEQALEITRALERGTLSPSAEGPSGWRIEAVPSWSSDAIAMLINETSAIAEGRAIAEQVRELTGGFTRSIGRLCTASLTAEAVQQQLQAARETPLSHGDVFDRIGLPPAVSAEERASICEFLDYVNGLRRHCEEVEEGRREYHISPQFEQYLHWMGLLQEAPEYKWSVPQLFLRGKRKLGETTDERRGS
jgi:hypothetical protein